MIDLTANHTDTIAVNLGFARGLLLTAFFKLFLLLSRPFFNFLLFSFILILLLLCL